MIRAQLDRRKVVVYRPVACPLVDRLGRKGRRSEPHFLAGEQAAAAARSTAVRRRIHRVTPRHDGFGAANLRVGRDGTAWEPLGPAMAHTLKGALDLRGNASRAHEQAREMYPNRAGSV